MVDDDNNHNHNDDDDHYYMEDNNNGGGKKRKSGNDNNVTPKNGFKALGLSEEVYRGIVRMGFRMPTPVQRKALPVILSGVDTIVMARTGSGKTMAFCIPLLEKLLSTPKSTIPGHHVRAIILSPTRELSQQTLRVFNKLLGNDNTHGIRVVGIHGAESMERQFDLLASKPDVIIATPGRLGHHLSEIPDFALNGCCMCILDEADRLLEMGFAMQLRQIGKALPADNNCQKVLLSATMPKVLVEFTKQGTFVGPDPKMVRLDQEVSVSADLRIAFITCRSSDKDAALLHVMNHIRNDKLEHTQQQIKKNNSKLVERTGLTLIFAATRHHVEYITTLLQAAGYNDDVTMIYGTLDQEARKNNLHAFKTGKKSVLVVTDVAARGIDVPLIDHVIHYHFPSSAKLFVHRSGRAARAGRTGFCWAFVEPEELPYMIDLHLFLGRKPSTGCEQQQSEKIKDNTETAEDANNNEEHTYTLDEMTPDMVHYGSLPESIAYIEVENVQRIMNSELSSSQEAEALRSLTKVCNNAMKQYRRTRPEASREAVRRAKAILEGERLESGQRIGNGGGIPPHPLLRSAELRLYNSSDNQGQKSSSSSSSHGAANSNALASLENFRQREEFLRAMANFRPKETVFEAFATGRNKDVGVVSQVDKGRTTGAATAAKGNKNKTDSSSALAAMKNMRRQMRMARDKGSTLIVAGSAGASHPDEDNTANKKTGYSEENGDFDEDAKDPHRTNISRDDDVGGGHKNTSALPILSSSPPIEGKRRLSKAERRRCKSNPGAVAAVVEQHQPSNSISTHQNEFNPNNNKKIKRGTDFRDQAYFIENDISSNTEEARRSREVEAAMQPNSSAVAASKGSTLGHAIRLEEAMLDIVGDENEELVQRQRMMRWDKSKRKYVTTTVGSELSGYSKTKKMKLESGQIVKADKLKLGELYEKWQKKTNRSVGRTGVFDDEDPHHTDFNKNKNKKTHSKKSNPKEQSGGSSGGNNDMNGRKGNRSKADDEVKSSMAIKKERAKKQDQKLKNMKKSDRRRLAGSTNNKGGFGSKPQSFAKKSSGGGGRGSIRKRR